MINKAFETKGNLYLKLKYDRGELEKIKKDGRDFHK